MSESTGSEGQRGRRLGRAPRLPLGYVLVLVVFACLAGAGGAAVLLRLGRLPTVPFIDPSATPTATVPPTLTPSATPSPSPTPTATPIPPARITAGDHALAAGDWPRALAEYAAVLAGTDDDALLAAAQLGLGLAHLNAGDSAAAIDSLTTFITAEPASPSAPEAQFILGDAYRAAGEWAAALTAYDAYLAARPDALDAYVQAARAQAAIALGDYDTAVAALQAAIAAPRQGDPFDLQEQLAEVYGTRGDLPAAVAAYDEVYRTTDQNWRKARVAVKAGQLLYADGQTDAAYAKFLDAVDNYPEAPGTFDGLLILVNDGVPVSDLQRGLTNYYAANYEPARDALLRYRVSFAAGVADTSAPGDATALYHLGLTYAALDDAPAAITAWQELVATYPGDSLWTKAYFQIAYIQAYPDDVATFTAFVAAAPESPDAPNCPLHRRPPARAQQRLRPARWRCGTASPRNTPPPPRPPTPPCRPGWCSTATPTTARPASALSWPAPWPPTPGDQARAELWIGKVKETIGRR
ncbi:MAG: tetratricopeptide repeat protein [Dermatophilaceae bacterium]